MGWMDGYTGRHDDITSMDCSIVFNTFVAMYILYEYMYFYVYMIFHIYNSDLLLR